MTRKEERGFALIEFLIVLFICGTTVAIALHFFTQAREEVKLLDLFGVSLSDVPRERPLPEAYITLLRPLAEKRIADVCHPKALEESPITDPHEVQMRLGKMYETVQESNTLCAKIRKTAIELGITPPYLTQQQ